MEALYSFDYSILNWIQTTFKCDFLDWLMPKITIFGDAGIFWICVSLVMIIFKRTRKTGLMMGGALLIGVIIGNGILKNVVARERPYSDAGEFSSMKLSVELLVAKLSDYSFPSGHTLASFECATVLMIRDKRFGIPALVLAVLIALSRLYLYVHFPTDIIAGVALGVLFAIISVKLVGMLYDKAAAKLAEKKTAK